MFWLLRRRVGSNYYELVPLAPDFETFGWREQKARILLASTIGAEPLLPAGSVLMERVAHLGHPQFQETWRSGRDEERRVA
jgi:hypothetical protein